MLSKREGSAKDMMGSSVVPTVDAGVAISTESNAEASSSKVKLEDTARGSPEKVDGSLR